MTFDDRHDAGRQPRGGGWGARPEGPGGAGAAAGRRTDRRRGGDVGWLHPSTSSGAQDRRPGAGGAGRRRGGRRHGAGVGAERRRVRSLRIDAGYLERQRARQLAEIERRRRLYLGDRPRVPIAGRTAIFVDDGIATGATVRAALRAVRRIGPGQLVLAVPVADAAVLRQLAPEADRIVCLHVRATCWRSASIIATSAQVEDAEVVAMLARGGGAAERVTATLPADWPTTRGRGARRAGATARFRAGDRRAVEAAADRRRRRACGATHRADLGGGGCARRDAGLELVQSVLAAVPTSFPVRAGLSLVPRATGRLAAMGMLARRPDLRHGRRAWDRPPAPARHRRASWAS